MLDPYDRNEIRTSFEADLIQQTPRSVLLGKRMFARLVKRFSTFHGKQRFITVFAWGHHWTQTWGQ